MLDRYKRIKAILEDSSTLAYLNFIVYLSSCVTPFLTFFQKEDPLVHVLYDGLNGLVRSLMLKFLKTESVENKTGQELCEVKCDDYQNWLSLTKIEVGVGTRKAIATVPGEDTRKELRRSFRKCLKALCMYLQSNLPLANPLLRDICCLNPSNRKSEDSRSAISRLCLQLIKVTKTDTFCDSVTSEWLTYMCDTDKTLEEWTTEHSPTADICEYWQYVSKMTDSSGAAKYPNLVYVAKSALVLAHGNAVPERGFSINNALLAKDRLSLDERSIVAERVVKDAVRILKGPANVMVTKELIQCARQAHHEYMVHLENEQKAEKRKEEDRKRAECAALEKREKRQQKSDMEKKVAQQMKILVEREQEEETAKQLISEASAKLSTAVKGKDLQQAKVAQVMLKTGTAKLHDTS